MYKSHLDELCKNKLKLYLEKKRFDLLDIVYGFLLCYFEVPSVCFFMTFKICACGWILVKNEHFALAGVAQCIECQPANLKCCWFDSWSGRTSGLWARSLTGEYKRQPSMCLAHRCFSTSPSPSLSLSLKINK